MFAGESAHTLDDKNRLVVPRRILDARPDEGELDQFVLTRGLDGCLYLFTRFRFERISSDLSGRSIVEKKESRDFKRLLFSSSQPVTLDAQNRILLPENLKARAEIQHDVVVLGVGDHVEIWAAEKWRAVHDEMEPRFEELASFLEGQGRPPAAGAGEPGRA